MGYRSEARLIEMAIRKRWEISDEIKRDTIDTAAAILQTGEKDRDRLAAARILIAAEKQNQDDEHKQSDIQRDNARRSRLAAIAARLGISESLVFDVEAQARGRIEVDGRHADER